MERREIELVKYLRVLWRAKWLILATTLAASAGAFLFASERPLEGRTFVATATIVLGTPDATSDPRLAFAIPGALGDRGVETQIWLMRSRNVLERASIQLLGGAADLSPAALTALSTDLERAIRIRPIRGTSLLEIRAEASSASLAEQRADAVVDAYVGYLKEKQTETIEEALEETKQSLDAVSGAEAQNGTAARQSDFTRETLALADAIQENAAELQQLEAELSWPTDASNLQSIGSRLGEVSGDLALVTGELSRIEEILRTEEASTSVSAIVDSVDEQVATLRTAKTSLDRIRGADELERVIAAAGRQIRSTADAIADDVDAVRGALESGNGESSLEGQRLENQVRAGVVALGLIAADLATMRAVATDSLVIGQLFTAASRISAVAINLSALAANLPGESRPASDKIATIRFTVDQVRVNADAAQDLLSEAAGTDVGEVAAEARTPLLRIPLRLGVLADQLGTVARSLSDPFIGAEVSAMASQVSASQGAMNTIIARLDATDSNTVSPELGEVTRIRMRMESVDAGLREISTRFSGAPTPDLEGGALGERQARLGAVQGMLRSISADLEALEARGNGILPPGGFLLIAERAKNFDTRLSEATTRLSESGPLDPEYEALVVLQRNLELLLRGPQDTGVSIVDTAAVLPVTSSSVLPGDFDASILLGGLAGLLLGIVIVLAMDGLDRKVRNEGRLVELAGLRSLGMVPRQKASFTQALRLVATKLRSLGMASRQRAASGKPAFLTMDQPASVFTEALQLVATKVDDYVRPGSESLLVTSPGPREGKTVLSVALARLLARRHRKTLLVDANLRKGDVSTVLGLDQREGLSTALTLGKSPLDYVVAVGDGLHVLPCGGVAPKDPVELLTSTDLALFLVEAGERFDVLIVDGPPVLGFAETHALAKHIGRALLVVDAQRTTVDAARESASRLEAAGAEVIGAVLNSVNRKELNHVHHKGYSRVEQHSEVADGGTVGAEPASDSGKNGNAESRPDRAIRA